MMRHLANLLGSAPTAAAATTTTYWHCVKASHVVVALAEVIVNYRSGRLILVIEMVSYKQCHSRC